MTRNRALAIAAAVLGCAAMLADLRPSNQTAALALEIDSERDHMSALDLAERIKSHEVGLRVVDLRSAAEFKELQIPGAQNLSITRLAAERLPRTGTIVLYSEGGTHAAQAWVLLRMQGYRNVFVLREGIYEWMARVMEPRLAVDATPEERAEFGRAAGLCRYFGGTPQSGVPRSEIQAGYWNGVPDKAEPLVKKIRRKGC
jgi:rhodanese-related sulfurtransferase